MANEEPMYNEADHQLIEDYLDGILSEEAKKTVEKRLQSDSNFATQFQLHQDIEGILDAREKRNLKQNWTVLMEEAEAEMNAVDSPLKVVSKSEQKKKKSFQWIRIAALILAFLVPVLLYWLGVFDQASPQELAMQYFETPESIVIAQRNSDAPASDLAVLEQKAQDFYEQKDYGNALKNLQLIVNQDSLENLAQVHFSMGLCSFLLKDYQQAAQYFSKVDKRDGIKSKANWHLALTYLQQAEIAKAKALLLEITERDASKSRQEKAKKLLKELE